ncbi:MAG: GAF domain-containing protein [Elusimicrobia bacterium]|nr:GAF domain-containing protein [Elusimicrobiota bacterium]
MVISSQAEALALLIESGRLLSTKLDLGELLRSVLDLAAKVVKAETASLLLLDESTGELYFHVALGLGGAATHLRLKPGEGIAGSVAQTLQPLLINDARADRRWSPSVDAQSGFETKSILAVPMTIKGRLVGVLEALNKKDGSFSQEDLKVLDAFASQASVAIENAKLFTSLKEEKSKLETLVGEMTDGAILADSEGRIVLVNEAAKRFVGPSPKNLFKCFQDMRLYPSWEEIWKSPVIDFMAKREEPKTLVLGGTVRRLGGLSQKLTQAPGWAETGWLCVFRDVTEQWHRELLKRNFLSLISHKLKTPLASVTGFSEVILQELEAAPSTAAALSAGKTILTQGRKLSSLVDKLLRYITLESPDHSTERKPVALDEIVKEGIDQLKEWIAEQNAEVHYHGRADIIVMGDRDQLRDVIKNLVENGIKFNSNTGKKVVTVGAETSGSQALITVHDTGKGIPPEDQDKVFARFHQVETFFTGQVDGWGLGLPFSKKVIESHGGRINLVSRMGQGTTVWFSLPCEGADKEKKP